MEKQMNDKHKIQYKGVPQGEGHMGAFRLYYFTKIFFLIN